MSFTDTHQADPFRNLRGSESWLLLNKLNNILAEQDIESYIVGGWVRDGLLQRNVADIDFAVASDALEVASGIAGTLGGKYVLLDKENRIGRVVLPDKGITPPGVLPELDFTTINGDIKTDLAQRDFTIDAMAVNLNQFNQDFSEIKIIDPFNGQDDIRRGIIRVVNETAFAADALRLLRAVRLAAGLGFNIEDKTESLIRLNAHLITGVAGERVREELLRLLTIPAAGQFISYLDELGLLTALFPELEITKGVQQPVEHHWDVFEHSLRTVKAVEFLFRQGTWEYAGDDVQAAIPWSEALAQHFDREVSSGSTRKVLLKLAALLHDISKPQARAIDDTGRMRFLGHAKDGAVVVTDILERLRFSSKEIKLVETEVAHHLRPGQMSQEGLPGRRAIYRYFRDTGETGLDILFLSLADHLATRGPELDLDGWREHTGLVDYVISQRFEQENIVRPLKLIDGHDIISSFGINPGPEVGKLLESIREAQASGLVTTREEALSFVEGLMKNNA
ncbi:MAG: HD domain-containing protein [Dehalococcoidales bacterium]